MFSTFYIRDVKPFSVVFYFSLSSLNLAEVQNGSLRKYFWQFNVWFSLLGLLLRLTNLFYSHKSSIVVTSNFHVLVQSRPRFEHVIFCTQSKRYGRPPWLVMVKLLFLYYYKINRQLVVKCTLWYIFQTNPRYIGQKMGEDYSIWKLDCGLLVGW